MEGGLAQRLKIILSKSCVNLINYTYHIRAKPLIYSVLLIWEHGFRASWVRREFVTIYWVGAHSCYVQHTPSHQNQTKYFTAIGTLISNLSRRLAWEEPALRDIVDYYQFTNIGGAGGGVFRKWPISIYSENVQHSIQSGVFGASSSIATWNEWQVGYNLQ